MPRRRRSHFGGTFAPTHQQHSRRCWPTCPHTGSLVRARCATPPFRTRPAVVVGAAAGTLMQAADDVDALMVVVGRRGEGGIAELVLGTCRARSRTSARDRCSSCPVMPSSPHPSVWYSTADHPRGEATAPCFEVLGTFVYPSTAIPPGRRPDPGTRSGVITRTRSTATPTDRRRSPASRCSVARSTRTRWSPKALPGFESTPTRAEAGPLRSAFEDGRPRHEHGTLAGAHDVHRHAAERDPGEARCARACSSRPTMPPGAARAPGSRPRAGSCARRE